MKITSTNLSQPFSFEWNGKMVQSGIYKCPVDHSLFLDFEGVHKDKVVDLRVHGGREKACYLFSQDHYSYWQKLYPNLEWHAGMFGENLTVAGLDETKLRLNDTFKIGTALVQVSQARQPCFKLGVRFGDQGILRQFIVKARPGAYIRIIEPGEVTVGQAFELVDREANSQTIEEVHKQTYRLA